MEVAATDTLPSSKCSTNKLLLRDRAALGVAAVACKAVWPPCAAVSCARRDATAAPIAASARPNAAKVQAENDPWFRPHTRNDSRAIGFMSRTFDSMPRRNA
jgi:hypothetical protein